MVSSFGDTAVLLAYGEVRWAEQICSPKRRPGGFIGAVSLLTKEPGFACRYPCPVASSPCVFMPGVLPPAAMVARKPQGTGGTAALQVTVGNA